MTTTFIALALLITVLVTPWPPWPRLPRTYREDFRARAQKHGYSATQIDEMEKKLDADTRRN